MWTVLYGRHWVYYPYKELRFETKKWYLAFLVYHFWYFRYVMSVYPVKYIKIWKVDDNVIKLNSFSKSGLGDYGKAKKSKRNRSRY